MFADSGQETPLDTDDSGNVKVVLIYCWCGRSVADVRMFIYIFVSQKAEQKADVHREPQHKQLGRLRDDINHKQKIIDELKESDSSPTLSKIRCPSLSAVTRVTVCLCVCVQ